MTKESLTQISTEHQISPAYFFQQLNLAFYMYLQNIYISECNYSFCCRKMSIIFHPMHVNSTSCHLHKFCTLKHEFMNYDDNVLSLDNYLKT